MRVRDATDGERRELGRPSRRSYSTALVRAEYRIAVVMAMPTPGVCLCGEREDVVHRCRCECGVYVDEHPPLPRPGPLASWKSLRRIEGDIGWDGRKVEYPGRAAASRSRAPRRPRTTWK